MLNIVSFRPGVISQGTAFEAMASIYSYLQNKYDYSFTIVKAESDKYQNRQFKIISIPDKAWQFVFLKSYPFNWISNRLIDNIFAQADIILTVDPTIYWQGLIAIYKAYQVGKPVWFDASRTDLAVSSISWKFRKSIVKKAFHKATGIIITVPKCIERFQNLGLFNSEVASKCTIMGHPINTSKFKPLPKLSEKDGILRVLVISRIVPEKGLLYILEAITSILQTRNNIQLHILGVGSLKPLLQKEIENRAIADKVFFIDTIPYEEIPSLLATVDLFVNHAIGISHWEEFFGVANLEAMACALPCIVSNSGGIPYAIREKGVAIQIEERNIVRLREEIAGLIDNLEERNKMGARARDYVKRYYDISLIGEKYHHMLQQEIKI